MLWSLMLLLIFVHEHWAWSRWMKTFDAPKGFGSKSRSKVKDPIKILPQKNLEETIQIKIDGIPDLREAMRLITDIKDDQLISSRNDLHRYHNGIPSKIQRMNEIEQNSGWNETTVRTKLQELTWDTVARSREERHQELSHTISEGIDLHMKWIATQCLASMKSPTSKILDVGCGNGVLLKYIKKIATEQKVSRPIEQSFVGIDLSSEMIKICRESFPKATFHHMDFLQTQPDNLHYETIVFNECLHYFSNPSDAIQKASKLLTANGKILLSHPKGYQNVWLQYSKNRWLVPSLLPNYN